MKEIAILTNTDQLNGTSFHGDTINISANALRKLFGKSAGSSGDGKVINEWQLLYKNDSVEIPFALYDWKEYKYNDTDIIEFHIGTHTSEESHEILNYLNDII